MKQALQLKIGQYLTLTPQLQQAIKLLQLSTIDLQQTIEETLEANPLLEREEYNESESTDSIDNIDFSSDTNGNDSDESLPMDTRWEDLLPSSAPPITTNGVGEENQIFENDAIPESLHSHLLWQLNFTRFSNTDKIIGLAFIDAVDNNGRLTQTPEEILEGLNLPNVELDEVIAVLHRLQHFEPTGVFASNLRECLLLQLQQMPTETPHRDAAKTLIDRYLEKIATTDLRQLTRLLQITEENLISALQLIRTLDPTPGTSIGAPPTEYIIPDIFVRRVSGHWRVELNPEIAPRLQINSTYTHLANKAKSDNDRSYVRNNLQEARWFIKSLQSRNETLLKVASKIVEHQRQFLEIGEEAMRPLILANIAQQIDMHESTVSRATTRKYMHTPQGVFELKYFFSSHVATTKGGECSSTAIKALVKKLIQNESNKKPLSDNKLCALLKDQGVIVARRTVAKYREQLNIPPSNERKRLI